MALLSSLELTSCNRDVECNNAGQSFESWALVKHHLKELESPRVRVLMLSSIEILKHFGGF